MFCVIQEIELKKEDKYGYHKNIEVYTCSFDGNEKYDYRYSDERFKRDIKKAYKITIHESYRENGKVKKKQYCVATMEYYSIVTNASYIFDYMTYEKKNILLGKLKITEEELYDIVCKKLDPLIERITEEFEKTKEYIVNKKNEEIINKYNDDKAAFEKVYGEGNYDYCYDVFGTLRNKEMLERIKKQYKAKEEQERRYSENHQSNYNNYNYNSSYSNSNQGNYNNEEKKHLKKIYKVLALHFHPDKETGDSEIMKTVNSLKDKWGL